MIVGRVIGNVVSTIKLPYYNNRKLLLVAPQTALGRFSRNTIVAVDTVNAGIGDTVLVAREGKAAMEILGSPHFMPMRSIIVGIVDQIDGDWK